eukprot:TRINITY_DN9161_c0_g1_i1.p1 TRINITY_DN9161_c0_g1~~TRINITY_DN9161_c0_g1_i1.p1  ORF type:complete len:274 (-),score=45.95 TRINITY_DN9161_c0_g1_i1:44-865(-)
MFKLCLTFVVVGLLSLSSALGLRGNASNACNDYYSGLDTSLRGPAFQAALSQLIAVHTELSYDALWAAFDEIDTRHPNCTAAGSIHALYTGRCFDKLNQCGSVYKKEGDCFNREHTWPKSWWGGFEKGAGAQTDLHILFPADGYVNNLRANTPFDNVESPTYVSTGGDKIGKCTSVSSTDHCFEPRLGDKGDMARVYFYLTLAYRDKFSCCDELAVSKWNMKDWQAKLLFHWHQLDPVDHWESTRNSLICEQFQQNRNPFIDHPEWVQQAFLF